MELTPWTIFTDLGFIAIFLLIGTLLRAKVSFVQRSFLPASIIAGLLGLILGPNGSGIIPLSNQLGVYPGILIAVIFGALPLISPKVKWKEISRRVGSMWSYSQIAMILMWGGGLLFSLLLLNPFWSDLHDGFGLILAAGFVGGHGSAAAIGDAFAQNGWEEARSLAMTSATVGVISAILIGMIFIKRGSTRGHTSFLTSFSNLPQELKTGLVPKNSRKNIQTDTMSPMSIDPYIFHVALVSIIAMGGYYLSVWGAILIPKVAFPAFSLAFIVGLVIRKILTSTKADDYVSKHVINRISGSATDLLVAFGIASISLPIVLKYIIPLSILFLFGLFIAWVFFHVLSQKFFPDYWFEKGIFTWGWTTGTVAMGIALLRIVDPDLKSKTLDDFGLAYIPIAPVEIAVITFAPLMVVNSQSWLFIVLTLGFAILLYVLARAKKWVRFDKEVYTSTNKEQFND